MRFAANIAMLFSELPFLERFDAAARAGFRAVEFWWPSPEDRPRVGAAARDAGVEVIRFALDAGNLAAGDAGLLCRPDREEQFRAAAHEGIELATELGCSMVNALAGVEHPQSSRAEQLEHGRQGLAWLADLAAPLRIDVLLEANNTFDKPGFLVSTTAQAIGLLRKVDRPNARLLYDAYHAQRMEGNLSETIRRHIDWIAHVQIADSPDRHEPGTGEINYRYVLRALHEAGYEGYVGLEYRPKGRTLDTLEWLPRELRGGDFDAAGVERLRC